MSASDLKPWCHLPGNSFPAALRKQPLSAPCMISTIPCSCTFLSHCLLLSSLSPSPSRCSFSPSSGAALPRRSSRRVHFERINTVPVKGQRAARRSTRRHHSLSRTLLRYYRKPTAHISTSIRGEPVHLHSTYHFLDCVCLPHSFILNCFVSQVLHDLRLLMIVLFPLVTATETSFKMSQRRTWNQKHFFHSPYLE